MTKRINKRAKVAAVAVVAVLAIALGGTLAWLQGTGSDSANITGASKSVTVSVDDGISNMISDVLPGQKVTYNPTVKVNATADAYVFVKVTDSSNVMTSTTPDAESNSTAIWTVLDSTKYPGVYYTTVSANNAEQSLNVFKDGSFIVSNALTNDTLKNLNATVKVDAYAIQKDYIGGTGEKSETADTASAAWSALNSSTTTGSGTTGE